MIWTDKVVELFGKEIYTGLLTIDDIPEKKIAVKYKILDEKETPVNKEVWGWAIPYGTQKIFLPDKIKVTKEGVEEEKITLDLLPIKIKKTKEFSYKQEVFLMVEGVATFKVEPKNMMSIRNIVNMLAKVEHSNPEEYKQLVILGVASYMLNFNWRISSSKGFGKNCLFDTLKRLCNDVQCYQPKSAPKLKKECHNRSLLVANEFMELSSQSKKELEDFFRYVGDNNPELENSSLASSAFGTLDKYSTDDLSVGVIYNLIEYYIKPDKTKSREMEFFDYMYSPATNDRYIPFLFDKGEINSGQFEVHKSELQEQYAKYKKYYLAVIKSMLYWQEHFSQALKGKDDWFLKNEHIINTKNNRLNTHYTRLLQFIKAYAETNEEYNQLADAFWDKYIAYLEHIKLSRIKAIKEQLLEAEFQDKETKNWENPTTEGKIDAEVFDLSDFDNLN